MARKLVVANNLSPDEARDVMLHSKDCLMPLAATMALVLLFGAALSLATGTAIPLLAATMLACVVGGAIGLVVETPRRTVQKLTRERRAVYLTGLPCAFYKAAEVLMLGVGEHVRAGARTELATLMRWQGWQNEFDKAAANPRAAHIYKTGVRAYDNLRGEVTQEITRIRGLVVIAE